LKELKSEQEEAGEKELLTPALFFPDRDLENAEVTG